MKNKKTKPVYEVIDDFVPDYTNDHIFKILSSDRFPWFLSRKVNAEHDKLWNTQYHHTLYRATAKNFYKSDYYSLVDSIMEKLNPAIVLRVKVNSTLYTKDIIEFPPHTDTHFKAKTCVYYVNDNNGYTYFMDGSKVYSKARRLVRFDSHHYHSGSTHSDSRYRFVININYIPREMIAYDKEVQS